MDQTQAFGPISAYEEGSDRDADLEESIDDVLAQADFEPQLNYGWMHFGDYLGKPPRNAAYAAALQQEYDPALVMLQHYLRTGEAAYFDGALDSAWHYVDVDISHQGGAYQHRATQHHIDTWVSELIGEDVESTITAMPMFDGSLESVLSAVAVLMGQGARADLEERLDEYREVGVTAEEDLIDVTYLLIGYDAVQGAVDDEPAGVFLDLRVYADLLLASPSVAPFNLGGSGSAFGGFFQRYGGSWSDVPSFHVDNLPDLRHRYDGAHTLIDGVLLAYYLTAEPRFEEVIVRYAGHLADKVVPYEVEKLVAARDNSTDLLGPRGLGWPLIALNALREFTEQQPQYASLHAKIVSASQSCVQELLTVQHNRIKSSIHAGVTLEALATYHAVSSDSSVESYITDLAEYWSQVAYDWNNNAFQNTPGNTTTTSNGYSGLLVYGLAYAELLQTNSTTQSTLLDAWNNLSTKTSWAKTLGMRYRSSLRAQRLIDDLGLRTSTARIHYHASQPDLTPWYNAKPHVCD